MGGGKKENHENSPHVDYGLYVGLCTDGARAMTGHERGLAARVQQVAPLVKWTHCMVHREALAAKKMPVLLDSVLNPIRENDKSHQITAAKLSLVWGPLPGDGVRA